MELQIATDGATISPNSGVISNGVGGTTYTVRYTVGANCPNSSTQQVTVKSSPEPNFEGLNLSGCKPLIVNFSNTSNSSETTCLWNFRSQQMERRSVQILVLFQTV